MRRAKRYHSERNPEDEGARCFECPLKGKSEPVWGEGPMGTRIAVVGEGPGVNETRLGRPFVGASGELLEFLLTDSGSSRSGVYLDNSTMCFPPGGNLEDFLTIHKRQLRGMGLHETFRHPVDCCRPRLFRALGIETCKDCGKYRYGPAVERCTCKRPIWVSPSHPRRKLDVVIPLGNGALKSLTGLEGISAWRGSALNLGEQIVYAKKSEDRRKLKARDAEDGDDAEEPVWSAEPVADVQASTGKEAAAQAQGSKGKGRRSAEGKAGAKKGGAKIAKGQATKARQPSAPQRAVGKALP